MGFEARADASLWLGWRQQHKQKLKLYLCAAAPENRAADRSFHCAGRSFGASGWVRGRASALMEAGRGSRSCGQCQCICPNGKSTSVYGLWRRSALWEEELGMIQRGGSSFRCSQHAAITNLSPKETHVKYSVTVHRSPSFL